MAKKNSGKYINSDANTNKTRSVLIVCICIAVVVLLGLLVVGYLYFGGVTPNKVMDNVSIFGVDISGMEKDEAIAAVDAAYKKYYTENTMVVKVLDHEIQIDPAQANVTMDTQAAVEVAYALGRTGSFSQRRAEQKQAKESGVVIDALQYLSVDEAAVRKAVQELLSHYDSVLTPTTYEVVGEQPVLENAVSDVPTEETQTETTETTTTTTTETTETPEEKPEPVEHQKLVITVGTVGYDLNEDSIVRTVVDAYFTKQFQIDVPCTVTEPEILDLDALYTQLRIEPIDAVMDMTTFEVSPHSFGYHFDLEGAKALYSVAEFGQVFEVSFSYIPTEVTTESVASILYRDLLSSYTAKNPHSDPNRNVNLKLACEAINGVIIMPGEVFDYNKILGERTVEKGYKPGGTYDNGAHVLSVGGGICQVSSNVYYCALVADMQIVTRINHGYYTFYVPDGMDATVSWGGPDFRFRNTMDYPIKIEAYSNKGNTTVKIYGTDNRDYYVKMKSEIVETYDFETEIRYFDADNPEGYKDGDVITEGVTGFLIRTYRNKYSKETNKLISSSLEATSKYRTRTHVVVAINAPDGSGGITEGGGVTEDGATTS